MNPDELAALPETLAECHEMRAALVADVQSIDAQLSARKQQNEDSDRQNDREYHTWHTKAVWAKTFKMRELGRLKAHMFQLAEVARGEYRPDLDEFPDLSRKSIAELAALRPAYIKISHSMRDLAAKYQAYAGEIANEIDGRNEHEARNKAQKFLWIDEFGPLEPKPTLADSVRQLTLT